MKFVVAVLIVLALCAALVALIWVMRRKGSQSASDGGEYFISTETETRDRASLALPTEPTEDMSHLVQVSVPPSEPDMDGDRDYLPDPYSDWAVYVDFDPPVTLSRSQLVSVFARDWLEANGSPTLYGLSPEEPYWTYVRAGGSPETYKGLCLGWSLCNPLDRESGPVDAGQLETYLMSLESTAARLGTAQLEPDCSVHDAQEKSAKLHALVRECDRDAQVILVAPKDSPFDGRRIWEVMLCLGLHWGDMDIFHLANPSIGLGDDSLFSVWTSTPPGYFFPEEIAAGRVQTGDLVFGFSVPRSADPLAVHDAMVNAAQYAQSRLGGTLLDTDGRPFGAEAEREKVEAVVHRMESVGLTPGTDSALILF